MFRVNRIGNHHLVSLSDSEVTIPITTANFAGVTSGIGFSDVQTDKSVPGDTESVMFRKDTAQTWDLLLNSAFCFGRWLEGPNKLDRPMQIGINGAVSLLTDGTELSVTMGIGRIASGSPVVDYTSGVNRLRSWTLLPTVQYMNGDVIEAYCEATVIEGLFQGTASNLDTQAIAAFWRVENQSGLTRRIVRMYGNVSAYRYGSDIQTYDPNR